MAMACALTRFGLLCRDLRISKNKNMGDQAAAMSCPVHYISSVETGKIDPTVEYIETFCRWLELDDAQRETLRKRNLSSVVNLRRFSKSNQSTSMRLFRKVSKMGPLEIRQLKPKLQDEARNDRGLSGPVEIG
jgi:transcriptional regulator with XRE-family HTH domain